MKKKIISGLILFSLLLFLIAISAITMIEHAATTAYLISDADKTAKTVNREPAAWSSLFSEIGTARSMLYFFLLVLPLAAVALGAYLIHAYTRSVNELLTATRRLKNGDRNYQIEGLKGEFREVAASFNEMARELRENCVRMQWTEQLMVLGEMAGGLAHEIKNPLAGIKAFVDVLSCDPSLSIENRMAVLKVAEQVRRIEALIRNILSFARPPRPELLLVDINSVFDSTVALAERHPAFAKRGARPIVILKDFDSQLPETMADPLQLQQMLLNLLLNAADAIPGEGAITIRTSYDAVTASVTINVMDTGRGIDEAIAGKIFQPFFTTKPDGTGLGLAITRGLVEQHGGSINVENHREGGVTFTIRLPVRTAEAVAAG